MCKSFTSRAPASLISDEDDFFSMQTSARETGSFWRKRRRHPATVFCENVVVAEASYQILEVLLRGKGLTSFNKNNCANFAGEKMTMKLSGASLF